MNKLKLLSLALKSAPTTADNCNLHCIPVEKFVFARKRISKSAVDFVHFVINIT